jgi:hypothetical protein
MHSIADTAAPAVLSAQIQGASHPEAAMLPPAKTSHPAPARIHTNKSSDFFSSENQKQLRTV